MEAQAIKKAINLLRHYLSDVDDSYYDVISETRSCIELLNKIIIKIEKENSAEVKK